MKTQFLATVSSLLLIACTAQTPAETSTENTQAKSPATTQTTAAVKPAPKGKIKATDMGGGFYTLFGPGGNIGVSIGDDGVYVIDDKFARFGAEIIDVIGTLSDKPIKFVMNTHHHGDHTGANAEMKAVGATILAHDNVRDRMSTAYPSARSKTGMSKPTDPTKWPTLTFSQTATLHFNGQTVKAIHTPSAHTAGDSIVHFMPANIIHMGDNFFLGMFPFVDVDGGGNLNGMIAAQKLALSLSDAQTKIIPGHGPLAGAAELEASIATLEDIRDRVQSEIDKGQTLAQMIDAKILSDLSGLNGFIKEDSMITAAYRSLTAE